MRIKRYVLDANIWFSYFISQQEKHLATVISKNELTLFYCNELIEEINRVASYKRIKKYNAEARTIVNFIKMAAIQFTLTYPIKNYIPDDEKDDYIVALALQTIVVLLPVVIATFYLKNKPWKKNIPNSKLLLKLNSKKGFHDATIFCCYT